MPANHLRIGFVRRGFSPSGGAESYLKRLARGVAENGHEPTLFTGADWPQGEWPSGDIRRLSSASATAFADDLRKPETRAECDVLMSLERVWQCDVYRAGDGVHRAWLERRPSSIARLSELVRSVNRKHRIALDFEEALFVNGGARRVIANSAMVQREIVQIYGYDAAKIDVIHNGVPVAAFADARAERDTHRRALGIAPDEVVALFVGSGWERKGLRAALNAVDKSKGKVRLLIAGRGPTSRYRSKRATHLGVVSETRSLYGAADIFLLPTLYDPFSNACLEALAAGLPIITTTANGFSEIIVDAVHGSILEDPTDVGAIVAALESWSDADRRSEATARNLQLAADFDISVNVRRTLGVLLQLAASAESTSG